MAEKTKKTSATNDNASKQGQGKKNETQTAPKTGISVVGIGASAGALQALQSFFDALPGDTGMAFVVVVHLHPEFESHFPEILQSHTRMMVKQVTKKVKIERDHVYVIPPNRNIIVSDSHLETMEFEEPHGYRRPIDGFFRSLAKGHQEAVAIILSGGGTDGAVGIKDIKEEGGLLMVQDPEEAEYETMPQAAIHTGLADVVLPVRELAAKLLDYSRHTPTLPRSDAELSEQDLQIMQRILAQVHARTGNDFTQYKRSTVLRRIQRRMQINGLTTLESYLAYMRGNANEATAMFNDILIGVTNFFRDRPSWDALEKTVIPALFDGKELGEPIRIWSIGCATGEGAYSLSMLLLEQASKLNAHFEIQIFASDLDEGALLRAREGLYPSAIEADVPSERLERFFVKQGNHYQVRREVRDLVLFTNHSVLIYLQRAVQDTIFDIFHYALNPGGYLFLGSSESAEGADSLFKVVDKTHRIYQAKPWRGNQPHIPSLPLIVRRTNRPENYTPTRSIYRHLPAEELPAPDENHQKMMIPLPTSTWLS